jgi:hypothetical protein
MVKKETKENGSEKESEADFLQRIMKMKETADKKVAAEPNVYASEMAEAKTKGKEMAQIFNEIEECEKIAEEFKKDPPVFISKTISGMSVEYRCEEKYQEKVALMKKRGASFIHAVHSTSVTPLEFNTYGKAYVKRGGRKAYLPMSSKDLPFIIRDGDIIGTEKNAFVLELKDEFQDEDNNYWHIFIFPNSELKIGVNERTSKGEPGYMEPDKVSPAIKKNSTSTTVEYSIRDLELLSGLFNLRIKRRGKNINSLVHFAPGFPAVEFSESGGLANELVRNEMEKVVSKLGAAYLSKVAGTLAEVRSKSGKRGGDDLSAFIELCKDGSVVIFSTGNRVALAGSDRMTKKISTDMYNPVKITATKGGLFETDGKKDPDYRVSEIMKLWMAVSQVAGSLTTKEEPQLGMGGKRLDADDAKEMLEYAKALGEEDIEKAAEEILNDQERRPKSAEKKPRDIEAEKESQKREAAEMLKFAEESGEEELIEVAKAQVQAVEGNQPMYPGVDMAEMEASAQRAKEYFEKNIEKCKAQIEASLPDYSSPISSDAV